MNYTYLLGEKFPSKMEEKRTNTTQGGRKWLELGIQVLAMHTLVVTMVTYVYYHVV